MDFGHFYFDCRNLPFARISYNFPIAMQADQSLGYAATVKSVTQQHGFRTFYRGAEARVGLLLIVNILNELLLKPAWAPVPVQD